MDDLMDALIPEPEVTEKETDEMESETQILLSIFEKVTKIEDAIKRAEKPAQPQAPVVTSNMLEGEGGFW